MSDEQDLVDDFDDDFSDLETIVTTDEEGNEANFFILDEVEYSGSNYLLVVDEETAEDEESDAVIFKQVSAEGDEFIYEQPNDEEYEAVVKILSQRLDDYEISF